MPKSKSRGKAHYRLKFSEAIDAHNAALKSGGVPGIINEGSIRSAISRPYNGYYRSIQKKSAVLVESVCQFHGFTDGNKRTCLILLSILLGQSGFRLVPYRKEDLGDALEKLLIGVACSDLTLEEIEDWMNNRIKVKPDQKRK